MPVRALTGTLESALYAGDLDAAERFYGDLIGLPVLGRQSGRHVFFAVGHSVLLVFNPAATLTRPPPGRGLPIPAHGATGPGHYCFRVAAGMLDVVRDDLDVAGIPIEVEIAWPGGARSIYVRDPDGNSIEFAETGLWFDED